ncbi:hypothetical protein AVEN_244434-1 [Araneus ventricosus]|uniref:C2H2-type domain-containing protein n=1 Tax=Araneus ventricosus TaxID=182803 RepID=A0A4Y2QUM0_ARAVE|nr:hypothetical protein AVEN_244434-1 [Araneus ventricosus]
MDLLTGCNSFLCIVCYKYFKESDLSEEHTFKIAETGIVCDTCKCLVNSGFIVRRYPKQLRQLDYRCDLCLRHFYNSKILRLHTCEHYPVCENNDYFSVKIPPAILSR